MHNLILFIHNIHYLLIIDQWLDFHKFSKSFVFQFFFISYSLQYNIKKKEEVVEQQPQEEPNPLMRKKKTPEELAAEAEQEDLDDFTSKWH